jgi:hypothetical protein
MIYKGFRLISLEKPDFNTIIDCCDKLLPEEKLEVHGFGKNMDLVLHIYKDEDFNPDVDKDYSNLVDIVTTDKHGDAIDDICGVYVTDGELWEELERINEYRDFQTL